MTTSNVIRCAILALFAGGLSATGSVLVYEDFSTYTNGNLVGQNSWQQFGTNSSPAIQVTGGQAVIPPLGVDNGSGQDAILLLPSLINAPASGTTIFYLAFNLAVTQSYPVTSYFAGMSILQSTTTSGNFVNARLAANQSGTGYVFGSRVTGQTGYPYFFGSNVLNYNEFYNLVARIHMVSGAENDLIELFVNPVSADFGSLTPYVTATFTSGTGTDPASYGSLVLSQFTNASNAQSGVLINRALVTTDPNLAYLVVPEPSAILLLAVGLIGLVLRQLRLNQRTHGRV